MRTKFYSRCKACRKVYNLIIPPGGDGTGLIFPRHHQIVGHINVSLVSEQDTEFRKSRKMRRVCPGSRKLVDDYDNVEIRK